MANTPATPDLCSSEAMQCWQGDRSSQVYLQDAAANVSQERFHEMQSWGVTTATLQLQHMEKSRILLRNKRTSLSPE